MNLTIQPKLVNNNPYLKNNSKSFTDNNNYEEPLSLQKLPKTQSFKGGTYDRVVEGIAKNYYGSLMQSGFIKWFGKKTENMNIVNLCSAVNSFIISFMYVIKTLENDNLDPERRNTLAINDGMTYIGSTVLAYAIDNKLAAKWNKVTHNYAATQLGATPDELQKLINDANERLFFKQIQIDAIQKANAALPKEAKIPLKHDIDILIENADGTLDDAVKTTLKDDINNAIAKANKNLPKDKQIALFDDEIKKIVDKSYELLNAPEGNKGLQDDINAALKKVNSKLPEGKKIPLTEDIENAIKKANEILSKDNKIPFIDEIKKAFKKANELLPASAKIKPEKIIANAEDYTRDVIKNRDLNFKIKGMGIVKSLFIFGMIYRYVVPVLIMKPANKLGAKYNARHKKQMEEHNKKIEMLREFEAKEAAIKELEAKFKKLNNVNAETGSSKYIKLDPKVQTAGASPVVDNSKYIKLEPEGSEQLANAS